MHGVWAVRMCCAAPRMFGHTSHDGWKRPALPGNHDADLRMPRHTQTAEHSPVQPRSSEIQSVAYAPTYVTHQIQGVPPHLGTEMQTYVCHGIQDGHGNQYSNTDSPRQPRTRIFADNARGGSPHRTLHVQCKASASLADRRLPVTGRPIQAFTPIPAGIGAYLRAPVCQMRSR